METIEKNILPKKERHFLPKTLIIDSWQKIEPFYKELSERPLNTPAELVKWMKDSSELEAVVNEDASWRYIRMTCDNANEKLVNDYTFFINEIEPRIAPYNDVFNRKLIDCPYSSSLEPELYSIYLREVKNEVAIFREKNIALQTQIQSEQQKYGVICGAMTIEMEGKEITMQKAASYLKNTDRSLREEAYSKIQERRARDENQLNELFDKLTGLRNQVALNADFANFRDYMFSYMGRFDYTKEDCFDFHNSVATAICPVINRFDADRKNKLGYDTLKPWDTEVDISGKEPLKPFENSEELINRTIECFNRIKPRFGEYIATMREMNRLDLDSRKGKSPGGYNCSLSETGAPFIFMNSVGSLRDLVTMVHEGGHAIHSFLSHPLEITAFKEVPSEVCELASMSMELISMEHWEVFFDDGEELKRAKREQLQKALSGLPWIARIDKFQHWIYENPKHTVAQRTSYWEELGKEFGSSVVDWKGYEAAAKRSWQNQLHLFEVPFYYIEYGFAQLGAIAMWRNYKQDPVKTIEQYEAALKLGYTRSIGELYRTAGIKFDFSPAYVKELTDFVVAEFEKI
jgi:oligoendopeptidase F